MIQEGFFPRSIGFDGPDGVNKTRFALITTDMLRQLGKKVTYVPLPFIAHTLSGKLIRESKDKNIPGIVMPFIFATNRYEIMPGILRWLKKDDHWVMFDRTAKSGPVFAEGLGLQYAEINKQHIGRRLVGGIPQSLEEVAAIYSSTIRALEERFPDVQLGIFVTRPWQESLAIMQRRAPSEEKWKSSLDRNILLQKKVRAGFAREIAGLANWHTVRVKGLANSQDEFLAWERYHAERIWDTVRKRFNFDITPRESRSGIEQAQHSLETNADINVAREIRGSVRRLSRVSSIRGIHEWV